MSKPNPNPINIFRGPSLASLLALVFIILKLTGHIVWSWWWVLSPIWIPWLIVLMLCSVFVAFAARNKS